MAKRLSISFDSDLLEAISSDFDLRAPNKEALRQLVFTLDGDYDPAGAAGSQSRYRCR